VADEELLVGAVVVVVVDVVDEMDDEDAVPVSPVDPVVPADELWVFVVPADDGEEEVESVEDRTAPPPGRSCATTTPMTTVAPVAATIAPRVSMRNRDWALSRSVAGLGWAESDMVGDVPRLETSPSEHARFDSNAEPAVVLL
jgi:hypothetical protein